MTLNVDLGDPDRDPIALAHKLVACATCGRCPPPPSTPLPPPRSAAPRAQSPRARCGPEAPELEPRSPDGSTVPPPPAHHRRAATAPTSALDGAQHSSPSGEGR